MVDQLRGRRRIEEGKRQSRKSLGVDYERVERGLLVSLRMSSRFDDVEVRARLPVVEH
jgi:hypothetical protein